jgi:transcriptional regulator with XRE-family HTH domain
LPEQVAPICSPRTSSHHCPASTSTPPYHIFSSIKDEKSFFSHPTRSTQNVRYPSRHPNNKVKHLFLEIKIGVFIFYPIEPFFHGFNSYKPICCTTSLHISKNRYIYRSSDMQPSLPAFDLEDARKRIAAKVRLLRKERHWTQAELAAHLHLSQNRLSEIERGDGSLTAEQFLGILHLFNVDTRHFIPSSIEADLQNALARLGALHLVERSDVLPSQRFQVVGEALRETLAAGGPPRLLTALAPVLVWNIDALPLNRIHQQLAEIGLGHRWLWLLENVLLALSQELLPRPEWAPRRRRAQLLLSAFLQHQTPAPEPPLDVLDAGLRSQKSLEEVQQSVSIPSRRWGIVTSLQPDDFLSALRAASDSH